MAAAGPEVFAHAPDADVRGVLLERDAHNRLTLRCALYPDYGAIRADWLDPGIRRRIAGGRRQPLARALGLHRRPDSRVLDASAGLGRDGYTLAALGAHVTLCERQPPLLALLEDALRRARADPQAAAVAARIALHAGDAASADGDYDAVYFDPMYPDARRHALPGKEMQILRTIAGDDTDADATLRTLLKRAVRVAVKRPTHAAPLGGLPPQAQIRGTQVRFDLYLRPN